MTSALGAGDPKDIADYFRAVFGDNAQGWLHIAYGILPYSINDSVRFTKFVSESAVWPIDVHLSASIMAQCAPIADLYTCPYLLSGPDKRAKGTSIARRLVHCDVDRGLLDVDKARTLPGAFVVGSGSPGNGHTDVRLTKSVPPHQHEALCRGLGAHLGAIDSKISDNDLLRPPGTFNHKPTVRGKPPTRVAWLLTCR
jgi:hypothetical protein